MGLPAPRTSRARRLALPAALVALGLAATGCSPGSSGTGSSSGAGTAVSASKLAELRTQLKEAQAVPTFAPQGPAFSVASLAGKKILSMPVSSQLKGCDNMARQVVDIAKATGMPGSTYFQNDGGPAAWVQGMNQAINGGYEGVALVWGIDPASLAPQMAAAKAAGMKVVDMHLADVSEPASDLIAGQTNGQFNRSMAMGVAQSLVESKGKAIDALVITSNENPPSVGMEKTVKDEYAKLCGKDCGVQSVNIPIPDYATKLSGAVSSALVANPKIKAVFMVFDAQTTFVVS